MERIYLIEDINGLKYVGRTKQTLKERLRKHKYNKTIISDNCSSRKLDLDKCTITCLDIAYCEEDAHELEKFYINSIDCVNDRKLNFDKKECYKKYRQKNKDKIKQQVKEYYEKNKDEIKEYQKEYNEKNKEKKIWKDVKTLVSDRGS